MKLYNRGGANIKMKGKRTMLNSCGCCDNFVNRKIESSLSKLTARKEIEEGIDEVFFT